MPLPTTLNTNEVKNSAGTEVEFGYVDSPEKGILYKALTEAPNLEHRLRVNHQETGTNEDKVRRSVAEVYKYVTGVSGKKRLIRSYKVDVIPVGDLANFDEVKNVSAELDSFCCTTGAATTVLFDGTGHGNAALINGTC